MKFLAAIFLLLSMPFVAVAQIVPQTTWYWQLDGTVNTAHDAAKVYDIDMEDSSPSLIAELHSKSHIVICYFSAGTWENWRSDAKAFPKADIGNAVPSWSGENYLNVMDPAVRTLMAARMDVAKSKSCDGMEPDNVDLYTAKTGFNITQADAINYDQWIAAQLHQRGMIGALKNSPEVVKSVVGNFDFSIAEQCFTYSECPSYSPFIAQNKGVLVAEYTKTVKTTWCAKAKSLRMTLDFFNLDLNGKRYLTCP